MAWLEQDRRTGIFQVVIRLVDGKLKRSLKTDNHKEATATLGTVEDTIIAIERGWIQVPDDVDLGEFLISGGKAAVKQKLQRQLTLSQLFERYFSSLPTDSLEVSTIKCMQIHERQLYDVFGKTYCLAKMSTTELQRFVERRSKAKGARGRPITAVTIKKPLITLRTVWNWGMKNDLINARFPHSGVKYPKLSEKPHFQTWQEIEQQIARGGISDSEEKDLWDCLFLTLSEIDELLSRVKANARHPFIYPMVLVAAHTGARKSEIVRSQVNDIDFAASSITIHERKRNQSMRTTRRVPISPLLDTVLRDWISKHPGGNSTFALDLELGRRKLRPEEITQMTRKVAHDHLKRTLAGSKWTNLRGWHVFRHSFCSNCAAAGVDQRIINAWVGHQTEDMVRRYRHLVPNQHQQAIRKVFGNVTNVKTA